MDISDELATAQSAAWSADGFDRALQTLRASCAGARIDWDRGAGEDWGRLLRQKRVIATLWRRGPFAFVDSQYGSDLVAALEELHCRWVVVDDWSSPIYSIDQEHLRGLLGRHKPAAYFDPAAFSANDLWWATV